MLKSLLCKVNLSTVNKRSMGSIAEGVNFEHIAREWRFKWSTEDDKKSLILAQQVLSSLLAEIKNKSNAVGVQRIVCGGCQDFKVIVKLKASDFESWKNINFEPEIRFLDAVSKIPGVKTVETQTYTIESI